MIVNGIRNSAFTCAKAYVCSFCKNWKQMFQRLQKDKAEIESKLLELFI